MTRLVNLLTQEQAAQLSAIVADLGGNEPAKPRPLTAADGIEIDPRSEAMVEAKCVDCKAKVYLDPTPIEGHEDMPRVPICAGCARARAKAAAAEQRAVLAIRRPQVAKHRPRTTDGIDHPVVVTHNTQENSMKIDLSNMSDAEIGRMMREQLQAEIEAALPAKRDEALKAEAKKVKAHKKGKKAEQKARQSATPLAGFAVGATLEVPALDLSDIDDLNVGPSAVTRSPYNKARFRLEGGTPLDPETTTYAVLAVEHVRLAKLAVEKAAAKVQADADKAVAKTAKPAKVAATVAVLDESEIANKVKALRSVVPGLSKKQAREQVLSILGA